MKLIKIRKIVPDIILPQQIPEGDWIDLRAAEDVEIKKGEFRLIRLGIAMQLPLNYEALLAPRSSTFKNYGIIQTNSVGIIDNSYCGNDDEWMFPALATRDTFIHKNDRICQFRLMHKQDANIVFKNLRYFSNPNRGGFGHTGVK